LTFLDDKLLPSTSNAVERGNRRYRKMQKSVYRVRTQAQIRARLALDMWREAQAEGRQQTLALLHRARAGINPVALLQSPNFAHLKTTMGLDVLKCKTVDGGPQRAHRLRVDLQLGALGDGPSGSASTGGH